MISKRRPGKQSLFDNTTADACPCLSGQQEGKPTSACTQFTLLQPRPHVPMLQAAGVARTVPVMPAWQPGAVCVGAITTPDWCRRASSSARKTKNASTGTTRSTKKGNNMRNCSVRYDSTRRWHSVGHVQQKHRQNGMKPPGTRGLHISTIDSSHCRSMPASNKARADRGQVDRPSPVGGALPACALQRLGLISHTRRGGGGGGGGYSVLGFQSGSIELIEL